MEFVEKTDGECITFEVYDEADVHEAFACFRRFLLACGYHPESIKDMVERAAEEVS
jgi:hypothetical protein